MTLPAIILCRYDILMLYPVRTFLYTSRRMNRIACHFFSDEASPRKPGVSFAANFVCLASGGVHSISLPAPCHVGNPMPCRPTLGIYDRNFKKAPAKDAGAKITGHAKRAPRCFSMGGEDGILGGKNGFQRKTIIPPHVRMGLVFYGPTFYPPHTRTR